MLSMLRFLMTATGLVLIVAAVGGLLLLPQMERHAAPMLGRSVSKVLGSSVSCRGIRFAPLLPGLELSGVTVAAADDEDTPLVSCERAAVRLDPSTVFSPRPAISELTFDGLVLHLRPEGGLLALADSLGNPDLLAGLDIRKVRCVNAKIAVADGVLPGDGLLVPLDPFVLEGKNQAHGATVALAALRHLLVPLRGEERTPPGLESLVENVFTAIPPAGTG